LTDLADIERNLLSGCSLYIFKVDKDTLGCLRTEIHGVLRVLGHALECLEHQVKLTDIGEVMLAAARTWHVVFVDERLHLFLAPAVDGRWQLDAVLRSKIFDELVGTESLFTLLTVHQRIGKTAQMTGSHPCLRVHEDGTVHTYVIRALLNVLVPPAELHIVFKLHI